MKKQKQTSLVKLLEEITNGNISAKTFVQEFEQYAKKINELFEPGRSPKSKQEKNIYDAIVTIGTTDPKIKDLILYKIKHALQEYIFPSEKMNHKENVSIALSENKLHTLAIYYVQEQQKIKEEVQNAIQKIMYILITDPNTELLELIREKS